MRVLLIGGLGYIASHMWKYLELCGHSVFTIDNLSTGHIAASRGKSFVKCDFLNMDDLNYAFKSAGAIDVVMHFGAKSLVGESIINPEIYYKNNVCGTLNILEMMKKYEIKKIIFSSTAATFGEPEYLPIDELHRQQPINPYGKSKLMVEHILKDYAYSYSIDSISLRYFNACGADPENQIGERHDPETHLLPLILQAASGRKDEINVFGDDYNTPDGTCIRDYIHVMDLCQAHEIAAKALILGKQQGALAYNLGNGNGFSVNQMIETAKSVVAKDGKKIKVIYKSRREGDPARLVADAAMAKKELGWKPEFSDLKTIVQHAWAWEKKLAGI